MVSLTEPTTTNTVPSSGEENEGEIRLTKLLTWFRTQHIWYDEKKVTVEVSDGPKLPELATDDGDEVATSSHLKELLCNGWEFKIRALEAMAEDEIVAKIPKESTLSWRTGGVANLIEETEFRGALALTITLLYELQQGVLSPWYGYLQALPTYAPLPCTWSLKELKRLEPLGSYTRLLNSKSDLSEDFEYVSQFVELHPEVFDREFFTETNFLRASTLVSSRAFQIDEYHGDAMVPFADLFNHRSMTEHVHFETDENSCDQCGGDPDNCFHGDISDDEECESNASDASESPESSPVSSPPPGLDLVTLKEVTDEVEESVPPCPLNGRGDHLECFDCDITYQGKNQIEMRLVRPVQKGEEVFNTYGQRDNQSILERYGFIETQNGNDYVSFSKSTIMKTCAEELGYNQQEMAERYTAWIRYCKLVSPTKSAEADEHDEGSESEEEEDGEVCLYCGQEHGVSGDAIDDINEATSLCPFYGDCQLEGESDEDCQCRNLERSVLFDKLDPHLFRLDHSGVPSPQFLVFLLIVALSPSSLETLHQTEDDQALAYLQSYLSQWPHSTPDPPKKKPRKIIPEPLPLPTISQLLKVVTTTRLHNLNNSSLPDDTLLTDSTLPLINSRLYYAALACRAERTILQAHLALL